MKILAVRGEGLASLARPFEIDLEAEPLRGAGVFAIVGPTGAGKSTLLDAICLALFDRTPRLAGRGPRLGGEDDRDGLSSRDPRHVLRRGVSRAVAEIDFRGIDGRAYRARWEVRRARGKADGKIQDATIGLLDLESERAIGGHTKKETLAEIEARLGLSFAQMTRAVLLAQGEFAAFLQAEDRERAELLERMTGTEIYGLVSIEAARRAREERATEARLLERACLVDVMDPVARAELEAKLPEQRLDVVRRAARTRDLERQARWWADLDLFAREEEDARRELADLDGQLGLAEARRRELEEVGRAESVRGELEALDRAARARDEASDARTRSELALAGARAQASEVEAWVETAVQARREAEDRLTELAPALARARELDRALSIAAERAAAARRRVEDRVATAASRRAAREALEATRAEHVAVVARAVAQRRACAEVDALHEETDDGAPPWPERVERARGLHHAREGALGQLALGRSAILERERALAAERDEAARWAEGLVRAEQRVLERRAALAREPAPDVVRGVVRRLVSGRDALARSLEHARRAALAAAREDEHARAAQAAAHADEAARERGAGLEAELAALAPALVEAERACELARAQLQLADRRADLRDGEECPLCGATDHPYARHAPIGRLLDALESRVLELRGQLDARRGELARAEAESASASRTLAWALREQGRAERERLEAHAASEACTRAAELEAIPSWCRALDPSVRALVAGRPAASPEWITDGSGAGAGTGRADDATAAWVVLTGRGGSDLAAIATELDAARARLESALERREAAEGLLALAIEERERATAAHAEADRALRRAETTVERDRARLVGLEREVERIERELAALDSPSAAARAALGWAGATAIAAADDASLERLARALADTLSARRREALARAALGSIEAPLAETERAESVARAEHAAVALELADAERALASLEAERAQVAVDDPDRAEREQRARLDAAREAHAAAHAAAARSRQALDDAERTERAARERAEALARELDVQRASLAGALERVAIDESVARAALARPRSEIAAWRRDLDALDARRARARAVLEERVGRRERHAAEPPASSASRADLDAELARAREQEDTARRLVVGAEQWIERDERARGTRDELLVELDAQRERVRTWTILESLIGSGDGKRFRVFAQGLTLDLLLSTANHQLERIAPRYALRRAPAGELAIQVIDREMGDEVRGVHGLSGGETFLVSLALALALASIAARRVPVGSLFVDEGFGGLDGESLEVALAALDALQASGRQVGVISHVPAIAERFAARIEVRPCGHAESVVRVIG